VGFLIVLIGTGGFFYLRQLVLRLGITGMSRNVSWALYIAQFTFLVGVAASAVMLSSRTTSTTTRPSGRLPSWENFWPLPASLCVSPLSSSTWGNRPGLSICCSTRLQLHSFLGHDRAEWVPLAQYRNRMDRSFIRKKSLPPPGWIKPVIYLSIPWAISIHTVTAFIYAGLPGRSFWLTAIMAPASWDRPSPRGRLL